MKNLRFLRLLVGQVIEKKNACKVLLIMYFPGEHATYFGENIPDVVIQPTEPQLDMHDSITAWSTNLFDIVLPPIKLDVLDYEIKEDFPYVISPVDLVLCINMIHISPFSTTTALFNISSKILKHNGYVFLYGPYRVNNYMGEGNIAFDLSLRQRNSEWGIRDLEAVIEEAKKCDFLFDRTVEMPANNLCVIFRKE